MKLCPSSTPEKAESVIGICGAEGEVVYIPFEVSPDSISVKNLARYASKCISVSCEHWSSGECRLAYRVLELENPSKSSNEKYCKIKSSCRWRSQIGDDVCKKCPRVLGLGVLV